MKFIILLAVIAFAQSTLQQIPDSFDARTKWPGCAEYILNQGHCGSCWAFSAAESLTDRYCIYNGEFKSSVTTLSPQALVSCDNSTSSGCNGGWEQSAWQYMTTKGLPTCTDTCTSGCSPYLSTNCEEGHDTRHDGCTACPTKCVDTEVWQPHKASSYGAIGNGNVRNELMTNGPVQACFTIYSNFITFFQATPLGIYSEAGGSVLGGHCIKLVGWGVEGNVPYWIIANSWGTNWGDKGFFRYRRGTNLCNLESEVYTGCPAGTTCKLTVQESMPEGFQTHGTWVDIPSLDNVIKPAIQIVFEGLKKTFGNNNWSMSIENISTQVVAGLNIKLVVSINMNGIDRQLTGLVHMNPEGSYKLTSIS